MLAPSTGWRSTVLSSARAGGPVEAAILDVRMPDMTGLEVAEEILAESPSTTVVLYSVMLNEATTTAARRMGVTACISKQQLANLQQMLEQWRARRSAG